MAVEPIEVEADTLDEARKKAESQVPKGLQFIKEEVIFDGSPISQESIADTTEAAYEKLLAVIPGTAVIIEKKEVEPPGKKVDILEALDENAAREELNSAYKNSITIESLRLIAPARQGFLGIGKKLNKYEAQLFLQAIVCVTYQPKPRIKVTVGKVYTGPSLKYMSESWLKNELKKMGVADLDANIRIMLAKQAIAQLNMDDVRRIVRDPGPITDGNLALQWAAQNVYEKHSQDLIDTASRMNRK